MIRFHTFLIFTVSLVGSVPLSAATAARVIYLNGVDISSAKNQTLEQVNVRIDAQGNVYVEAPQYEVQQESTFVPLSRQMPPHPNLPEHKAPGPLTQRVDVPATKQELASPPETGDTLNQPETGTVNGAAATGMMEKEGTRKQPDASPSKDGSGAAVPPSPQPNP